MMDGEVWSGGGRRISNLCWKERLNYWLLDVAVLATEVDDESVSFKEAEEVDVDVVDAGEQGSVEHMKEMMLRSGRKRRCFNNQRSFDLGRKLSFCSSTTPILKTSCDAYITIL